jgi:hypothetical protein
MEELEGTTIVFAPNVWLRRFETFKVSNRLRNPGLEGSECGDRELHYVLRNESDRAGRAIFMFNLTADTELARYLFKR